MLELLSFDEASNEPHARFYDVARCSIETCLFYIDFNYTTLLWTGK
jgi:hypothetical protein